MTVMQEKVVIIAVMAMQAQMNAIWILFLTIRSRNTPTAAFPIPMTARPATWLNSSYFTAV